MIIQAINNIAAICAAHGIKKAVLSPGSRCAPLTLAFSRHSDITCYTISDERSAAFIALGMAQASREPVVLICTSGSAAYNYAPAVAEAFFQQVPLLILTADRPPEWIDQWDGQTIRQENIYGRHIKRSFNFPVDTENQESKVWSERMVNEAIIHCSTGIKGPVHINIPIREPFYPESHETWRYEDDIQIIKKHPAIVSISGQEAAFLKSEFAKFERPLIILGQAQYSPDFFHLLGEVCEQLQIPVICDIISNGHQVKQAIRLGDNISMPANDNSLSPDLIISFGKSIISKNIKLLLRKSKAKQWHICPELEYLSDPFISMERVIQSHEYIFLHDMANFTPKSALWLDKWLDKQNKVAQIQKKYFNEDTFSEFKAVQLLLNQLPENAQLHLANSMAVRYSNLIGIDPTMKANVWANRGTSGIDGSNSTALGHALVQKEKQHILISGDVAFFYDRNAFWHNYPYPNLKILLLNNNGGTIFGMIKGPKEQAELGEFFETKQALDAKSLAAEFGIEYIVAKDERSLQNGLRLLLSAPMACILEVKSSTSESQELFEKYKNTIKEL